MIRGLRPHQGGFTILETIIVLTVMVALLGSSLILFRQRVPRTQFQKGLNELTTRLTDAANQVASGNYPNMGNFSCQVSAGIPNLSNFLPQDQGTNQECIFIGQSVQFGLAQGISGTCSQASPNDNCDTMRLYTVFGARVGSTGDSANNITEANAMVSDDYANTSYTTGYGLYVTKVKYNNNNPSNAEFGGVAYAQSFGARIVGDQPSGAPQVSLVPLETTNIGMTGADFANNTNAIRTTPNPPDGVLVCLRSGSTDQYAVLILGAGGNTSSVEQRVVTDAEWGTLGCV